MPSFLKLKVVIKTSGWIYDVLIDTQVTFKLARIIKLLFPQWQWVKEEYAIYIASEIVTLHHGWVMA